MSQEQPDPLALDPRWHVDCRIEAELPEDKVIGKRFIIHAAFVAAALSALTYTGWLGFVTLNLRHQISDWDQRIKDNRAEVREVQGMQRDYAADSVKIDQAHQLVRPQLYVSRFVSDLGRTRPEKVAIDTIEWNDSGIVVRGSVRESSERASRLLAGYVEVLRKDEKIGPIFREIVLTDLDRGGGAAAGNAETLRYEIKLTPKGTG
jgi:Tfp pilus assembly protein PilN